MTITVPIWFLWIASLVIGIPAVLFILMLAWIGWQLTKGPR